MPDPTRPIPPAPGSAPPPVNPEETSAPHTAAQPGIQSSNFKFPEGFLWGAATSAHQVEGNNRNNDWWAWEQAGRVENKSGAACDHYNRFREDFDLARDMKHNAHRFSLEWSRIEPEEGRFDAKEIEHYAEVLRALRDRGMSPVVTLLHYTLPLWLSAAGGWENHKVEEYFERFVDRVVREYQDLADIWITLNEPVVHVYKSYILGQWPPGKQDLPAALQVMRRMLRAHVRAYHAIHEIQPSARVSIAKHVLALSPCNPHSMKDRISTFGREYLFNQLFVDALHTGALRVPGMFWERLPAGRTMDFIGLNYYTRDFVHNTGLDLPGILGGACEIDVHRMIGKRNSLGWEVYPEGLARFLKAFGRYKLPLLITENGIPTERDGDRWFFILLHLWQVARAIGDGVPVVGYMYWSLLDNFEWAEGFKPRFGLVGVNYETQERTVRESGRNLAEVIQRNEL